MTQTLSEYLASNPDPDKDVGGLYTIGAYFLRRLEWAVLIGKALVDGEPVPATIVREYLEKSTGAIPHHRQAEYPELVKEFGSKCYPTARL